MLADHKIRLILTTSPPRPLLLQILIPTKQLLYRLVQVPPVRQLLHRTLLLLISQRSSFAAGEVRSMLLSLLAIPHHLSWTTYARVSSNNRLLPAIQFFIPKATTVQRWYRFLLQNTQSHKSLIFSCRFRACRVRRCVTSLKASASAFCSLLHQAASAASVFHARCTAQTSLTDRFNRVHCVKPAFWRHHAPHPANFEQGNRVEMGTVSRPPAARDHSFRALRHSSCATLPCYCLPVFPPELDEFHSPHETFSVLLPRIFGCQALC